MQIYNTRVYGFEPAIRSMRNPLASHHRSDSQEIEIAKGCETSYLIGEIDLDLAQVLIEAGTEHAKFLRMIQVWADFDLPRYLWSEFDTYKFNTKNSYSTMHRLLNNTNPITKDMFVTCEEDEQLWDIIISALEDMRVEYKKLQTESGKLEEMNRLLVRAKRLLPEGFLQIRTVNTNYAELRHIYFQRKNHRLKEEWHDTFCAWVESLPYAKELLTYVGE